MKMNSMTKENNKVIFDSYSVEQNNFMALNERNKQTNETDYHLRQIHRLLYILVSDKLEDVKS